MRAAYYELARDETVTRSECSPDDIRSLIDVILSLNSPSGHPVLDISRDDGSNMMLATDGERALVVWVDPLHESYHSVGDGKNIDETMIFNTFGTWSEAPGNWLVNLDEAIECIMAFARTGTVGTGRVTFEPD
jgi:hypothetical protein